MQWWAKDHNRGRATNMQISCSVFDIFFIETNGGTRDVYGVVFS